MSKVIPTIIMSLMLLQIFVSPVEALTYKFPWAANIEWKWWDRGGSPVWHGCNSGRCSIDVGSTSYREVVSPASGTIVSKCMGSKTVDIAILHDDGKKMSYMHFDKSTVEDNVQVGKYVVRGQLIGRSKIGSFSDYMGSCGYTSRASQLAGSSHLHWSLPTGITHTFDGWSLRYPNLYMEKNGTKRYVSSHFLSTNYLILRNDNIASSRSYSTRHSITIKPNYKIAPLTGEVTLRID